MDRYVGHGEEAGEGEEIAYEFGVTISNVASCSQARKNGNLSKSVIAERRRRTHDKRNLQRYRVDFSYSSEH